MAEKLMSRQKASSQGTEIAIDYPREEELVFAGHYTVRISGLPDAQVEISINDGEWQGCRTAVGYYWYDWQPAKAGEYVLNARLRVGKSRLKKADQRYCRVVVGKKK